MMTGITQGYTKNSESRGIGYQGKIIEQPDSRRSVEASGPLTRAWGQSENKIGEIMQKNFGGGRASPWSSCASTVAAPGRAGKLLALNLGWSHQIKYPIPGQEVSASILQAGTVSIFGVSSFKVNQTAADTYKYKKPEPYKGKGIRYDGEKFFEKTRKG